jgi:hypothetical protein
MDEKVKKTSVLRGKMPTQHMDEKVKKKHLYASRGRIANQYMDEKRMRLPPWWNFRVSIGQNMCNIQYTPWGGAQTNGCTQGVLITQETTIKHYNRAFPLGGFRFLRSSNQCECIHSFIAGAHIISF